jgi:hypothetical protein
MHQSKYFILHKGRNKVGDEGISSILSANWKKLEALHLSNNWQYIENNNIHLNWKAVHFLNGDWASLKSIRLSGQANADSNGLGESLVQI